MGGNGSDFNLKMQLNFSILDIDLLVVCVEPFSVLVNRVEKAGVFHLNL